MYRPCIKPMQKSSIDPAYLVQMQYQMLAAGVQLGYLVSWSRVGLTVHRVPFNRNFISCSARVLKYVIETYIDPEIMPTLSSDALKTDSELERVWTAMLPPLNVIIKSCENVRLDSGAFQTAKPLLSFVHCQSRPHKKTIDDMELMQSTSIL